MKSPFVLSFFFVNIICCSGVELDGQHIAESAPEELFFSVPESEYFGSMGVDEDCAETVGSPPEEYFTPPESFLTGIVENAANSRGGSRHPEEKRTQLEPVEQSPSEMETELAAGNAIESRSEVGGRCSEEAAEQMKKSSLGGGGTRYRERGGSDSSVPSAESSRGGLSKLFEQTLEEEESKKNSAEKQLKKKRRKTRRKGRKQKNKVSGMIMMNEHCKNSPPLYGRITDEQLARNVLALTYNLDMSDYWRKYGVYANAGKMPNSKGAQPESMFGTRPKMFHGKHDRIRQLLEENQFWGKQNQVPVEKDGPSQPTKNGKLDDSLVEAVALRRHSNVLHKANVPSRRFWTLLNHPSPPFETRPGENSPIMFQYKRRAYFYRSAELGGARVYWSESRQCWGMKMVAERKVEKGKRKFECIYWDLEREQWKYWNGESDMAQWMYWDQQQKEWKN